MLRQKFTDSLKQAMLAKDERTTGTVRMIMAKLKDKDIEARPKGNADGISEADIQSMLQGMVKQRRESIDLYKKGNREDLAKQEAEEIAVIERFLPQQMSEGDMKNAVNQIIASVGASGVKDMGKVMAELKSKYAGQMDFAAASNVVKALLSQAA
jgi:uncharacterized protein